MKNLHHILSRKLVSRKNQTRFAKAIPAFALGLFALLSFAAPQTKAAAASSTIAVTAGPDHSLFVTSDGKLYGMGNNIMGQLGNDDYTFFPTPVQVATSTTVIAVAAGGDTACGHSLFVTSDGKLFAMGNNIYGQLGSGTTAFLLTPKEVATSGSVIAVAAGVYHSLFVTSNGRLYAMGHNGFGQFGTGSNTSTNAPVLVQSASNVKAVAAGLYHSLYVTNDNKLYAMGWYA